MSTTHIKQQAKKKLLRRGVFIYLLHETFAVGHIFKTEERQKIVDYFRFKNGKPNGVIYSLM